MKKLLMFLMVAIPILVIMIVKITATVTIGDVFIPVEKIELSETSTSVKFGTSLDLSYTIYPANATNKDVIWSSSNDLIATVDLTGHVEFIGIGSGYITATTKDGDKMAQCSFYIWDTAVHRVELTSPQKFVHIGDTLQLNVTVLPDEAINRNVSFTSSNEDIATVDSNGKVHGLKEGEVTIKVISEEGQFSDFVNISVITPVTALVVEQTEIITSSKEVQVEYLIEPSNATYKNVTFAVDNEEIAKINNLGRLTFIRQGQVNVTITTLDGNLQRTIKYIYTDGYAYELIIETPVINMNIDEASVCVEYHTLPEYLYKTEVQISSSDESVAYVEGGYLHAIKGGNTVLTLKVYTSEDEYIEKYIYVNIESPARDINIEDGMTAEKTYELSPKSLPEGSTNSEYFYHIENSDLATVSENGLVTFNTSNPCTVQVTIYANKDYSDVHKTVNVTYTAGKAGYFELLDKNITLEYGQTTTLNCKILPSNTTIKPIKMTIEDENAVAQGISVVEVLGDGRIKAIGGGKTKLKIEFTLYNDEIITDYCQITVLHKPNDIDINLDLEFYNNQYVTSENKVAFSGIVLPLDATEKNITWSVSDRYIAFIRDDTLIFNQVGFVTLIATIGEVSKSVEIYYAGSNPVFAEVQANYGDIICPIPEKINVGESFNVEISKIIPNYVTNPSISIQAINQKTAHASGKALQVDGNTVKGVGGGTATLVVYISSSIRLNFNIFVEQKPDSISVLQANTQVTTNSVNLVSQVLPYDATNQNVRYVVAEEDIAFVEGSTLTFKKNGLVHITAIAEGDESVTCDFTIKRIEKNVIHISLKQNTVSVNKDDVLVIDNLTSYTIQIEENKPLVLGEEVAVVEGKYLRCLSAGSVKIIVKTLAQTYKFEIFVAQLVEDIIYRGSAELYEDEYVVGKDVIDLDFEVYPNYAENKEYSVSIAKSTSNIKNSENIAFISDNKIYFMRAGVATIQVESKDGNTIKTFKFNYTGGDALDAQLNVDDNLVMDIGDKIVIDVLKWLPFDTTNQRISLYEVNSTGKKIIQINEKTRTIVALDSGETKLVVELSKDIVKEIKIICVNKVSNIEIEQEVLTADSEYTIEAEVYPKNATNKELEYLLHETDLAVIDENVVRFIKPGTVTVVVKTTDGSEIEKTITITSTLGYIGKLVLDKQEIQLKKGEDFKLIVEKYPLNATENKVQFKILSQEAFDGQSQVINLTEDGQITALCSGKALVRAYALDYYGREVGVDCQITVVSLLNSIEVKFGINLDQYQNQNTFITSKNEIPFEILYQPEDATIDKFYCEISDQNKVKVEDNKIIFLQKGRVTITFVCLDKSSTEKTKIYTFYYVENDLIDATLDKTKIDNNVINLKAGENFIFALERALPSDITNLKFTIKDVIEKRIDPNKQVAKFENNTIYALNGGTYSFTLYVNDLKLESLVVNVTRDAVGIQIDGDEDVIISVPNYKINAHALESDTSQNQLGFKTNNDIATVSYDGNVTFKTFGSCEITVFIQENPSISKIVKIKYTKELQAIEFNQTRENMYVGEYIDLTISPRPFDAEVTKYSITLDNDTVAKVDNRDEGFRLIGLTSGKVVVTVTVEGTNISTSKEFTVFEKIKDIKLELDSSADLFGHGKYRVFGLNFFDSNNSVVKTYAMQLTLIPSDVNKDLLEWSSNDESTATVDENGVVTFIKTGKVTITVKQKAPYQGANVAFDSYEFTIVDGINVYTPAQFKLAHNWLKNINANKTENYCALVLHDDITIDSDFGIVEFFYNVYGNGYMLDRSKNKADWAHFIIRKKDNIELDNVILRGVEISGGKQLNDTGNTLIIEYSKNVLLYNTIIENAETAIRIQSSQVVMDGCIFRNCLLAGIKVARDANLGCDLRIKDSIFTSSFCGIMLVPDTLESQASSSISLEGEVRFYNFSTLKQIEQGLELDKIMEKIGVSFVAGELYKQLGEIAKSKGENYAFDYNGDTYYNFAIIKLSAKILNKNYVGVGNIDRSKINSSCNYSNFNFSGALNLGVVIPVELQAISLNNDKPFINPGDTYVGNDALLNKIQQPSRF